MMNVESLKPRELSANDVAAWRNAANGASPFASPFFQPDYVSLLGEFRPQVEVAVVRRKGIAVGWLPFERHQRTVGQPLGIKLADFQGAIIRPGENISLADIVSQLGLTEFYYDHLIADQAPPSGGQETADSPYLDLRDGYGAYVSRQRSVADKLVAQALKKERKLARAARSVEFRWHDDDPLALEFLWKWKGAQRLRTGTMDILRFDWVRAILTRIARTDRPGFHGVVSTLRVNDEIAAVHLGMHTDAVLHYWFPAYGETWGSYSTGLILMLHVAEECANRGIERIDLGKGNDGYKASFANGIASVAAGTIDRSPLRRLVRHSAAAAKQWIKRSPLCDMARLPARWWRQWQTQTTMRAS